MGPMTAVNLRAEPIFGQTKIACRGGRSLQAGFFGVTAGRSANRLGNASTHECHPNFRFYVRQEVGNPPRSVVRQSNSDGLPIVNNP
jgi:hypothetical protein